MRNVAPRN
jgi:hypothetical protein